MCPHDIGALDGGDLNWHAPKLLHALQGAITAYDVKNRNLTSAWLSAMALTDRNALQRRVSRVAELLHGTSSMVQGIIIVAEVL